MVADRERVDIGHHTVIYNVTDEMKKVMTEAFEPTFMRWAAEVRSPFGAEARTIAGRMVPDVGMTWS